MAGINVTLDGTLTFQQVEAGGSCSQPGTELMAMPLTLLAAGLTGVSGAAGSEISQGCFTVNSPSAFVTLAFPSSLRARVVMLRAMANSGPFDVRITYVTTGAVTIPGQYLLLSQVDTDEEISQIEVQGVGDFAWAAVGVLV